MTKYIEGKFDVFRTNLNNSSISFAPKRSISSIKTTIFLCILLIFFFKSSYCSSTVWGTKHPNILPRNFIVEFSILDTERAYRIISREKIVLYGARALLNSSKNKYVKLDDFPYFQGWNDMITTSSAFFASICSFIIYKKDVFPLPQGATMPKVKALFSVLVANSFSAAS